MKIVLAPMDGLTDYHVRSILTQTGGFDLCVTEFLRVTNACFPPSVFYKTSPELDSSIHEKPGHTACGVPVFLQLLGSDAKCLADNASIAASLGAPGIDLNFGCPAKTVNRHCGGAVLLDYPEKLYAIVHEVRKSLPEDIPLSAKIRLGYNDTSKFHENVIAIEEAGASWLTVHARTKTQGYRPPAWWSALNGLHKITNLPIIANGEIWSVSDYFDCVKESGCNDVMIGRGAMVYPALARDIKNQVDGVSPPSMEWNDVIDLLDSLQLSMAMDNNKKPSVITARLKLWVKWLMGYYTQAELVFDELKTLHTPQQAINLLRSTAS